jgi:predicted RNA-binding protein YlqC (UPF0109 family)
MSDEKEVEVYRMLLAVARSLVDRPDDIKIAMASDQASTVFTIEAHPSDLGKLIGAKGRTARALRVIVSANGARLKRHLGLNIVQTQEPEG